MEHITEIASNMERWQYLILYILCFVFAIIIASIKSEKAESVQEGIIALLALFGGMLAVGFVTCRLRLNPGMFLLAVLALPMGMIGYPAIMFPGAEQCGHFKSKNAGRACTKQR